MSGQNDPMSRSTFRNAAGDVAWQKQLRDRYEAEGVPLVPHLDIKRAIVRPVSRHLAEQIIFKYEWLGTMANTHWHYGIFFGSYCAGVCCVGSSSVVAGPYTHHTFGIDRNALSMLARGACVHWAPNGTNSKLVAWTLKFVARLGFKIILAYSDSDAGEIGTIYQACNWVYIGKGIGRHKELIAPNGRILNETIINKYAKHYRMSYRAYFDHLMSNGWHYQETNAKGRYIYILDKSDKALVDRVEHMRQPYPKRVSADEATQGAPGTNQGRGVQISPIRSLEAR